MKYKDLISKMSLEQKASLMSGKDFWQTKNIDKLGIPSIFLSDGPHGLRKQAAAADHLGLNASLPATCFPTAATMANTWNLELGKELGEKLGEEALVQKVNVVLGPGTCMKRNPRCGRNFEYFSEDPYLAGKMASSYIQGIQSNGISACVKHYAANNQETRRMTVDTIIDERTLREIYLTAFEIAVKEGKTKTLMSSYNMINGAHVNENMHVLHDILRDEWKYKGVVVSDWGGNNDRVKALLASNELEMPTTDGETNIDIVKAVRNKEIDESVLDECVDRLLTLIFDTEEAFKKEHKTFNIEEHHSFALKAAEEAMVLLKNDNNVLPLASGTKVAIIGDFAASPRYQGAGSSIVNPTRLDDTLEFIKNYDVNYLGYEKGFKRYGKKDNGLVKKAMKLAEKADVVLYYMGYDEVTEAEGLDRKDMKLPENQIHLLKELRKVSKKIVIILSCGSSIEMDFDVDADAVLHTYLSGQAGAQAILNVLTGKVNPSGKLSETYPLRYEDCASSSNFLVKDRTVEYREGLYIGYRYFDSANIKVKYPFGYGLSYTKFEYSNLKINDDSVTFDIKNIGNYDGAEVAELYVGTKNGVIFRPKKELKGFTKVFLKKNETKTVTIPFDDKTFRYFNVKTNKFEIEGCTYSIMIGASVEDIRLQGEIVKEGTTKVNPYEGLKLDSYYSYNVRNVGLEEYQTLLGHDIPNPNYDFYKKNRMLVNYNTTVAELRYAPGWSGRFFARVVRHVISLLTTFGKKSSANTLVMGVLYMPLRGVSRMTNGAICWGQLNGLIMMFNGHFYKGLRLFFKEGKKRKAVKKQVAELEKKENSI